MPFNATENSNIVKLIGKTASRKRTELPGLNNDILSLFVDYTSDSIDTWHATFVAGMPSQYRVIYLGLPLEQRLFVIMSVIKEKVDALKRAKGE